MATVAPYLSSVQFSGPISTLSLTPNTLNVTQQEFQHDIAQMQYWGGDVDATVLESGVPMQLTWGRPTYQRTFYGYVNHRGRTNNALSTVGSLVDRNSINITCVGATWPLKQAGTMAWFNVTADEVAVQIAGMFGLSADVTPHPYVWPNLQMSGKSFWQFLCSLGKRIGYTVYPNGPQIVFKPRNTNPNDIGALAAVYDYKNNPSGMPIFSPVLGVNSPQGGQNVTRQLAGIDLRTNQEILSIIPGSPTPTVLGTQRQSPLFAKVLHCSVATQGESNAKTLGEGNLNQLYITSTVQANGNPSVAQGSLVYAQNANGSQNGLWFVQKAVHALDNSTYALNMEVGRDSMGGTAQINSQPNTTNVPNAALIENTWVAA